MSVSENAPRILTACPSCGRRYRVPAGALGHHAPCKCGERFIVEPIEPGAAAAGATATPIDAAAPPIDPLGPPLEPAAPAAEPTVAQPIDTGALPLEGEPEPPRGDCAHHPGKPAAWICGRCATAICALCDFPQPGGVHLCPGCATLGGAAGLAAAAGLMCRTHPAASAVAICGTCDAPVCVTCDFAFPGGLHFCPACATSAAGRISSGRRGMSIGALVLLGVSLLLLMSMLLMPAESEEAVFIAEGVATMGMFASIVGLALGVGSLSRRHRNTPLVWVASISNIVLFAIWVVLTLVGLFMLE